MITAKEARRDLFRLLEEVFEGEVIGITKRGKIVATINPVKQEDEKAAQDSVKEHFEVLRQQPVLNIPRGTRDELYGD